MNLLSILNWLYPPHCIFCHDIIPIDKYNGFDVCYNCVEKLPLVKGLTCNKCGRTTNQNKDFCNDCSKKEHIYTRGWIALEYNDMTKQAIYRFKYRNCPRYSKTLAYIMYKSMEYKDISMQQFDLIVPIPIHKNKLKKRGYNQAELLAKELSYLLKIPCESVIIRTKDTKPQSELSPKERLNNLKEAFKVHNLNKIMGKRILLIDDIYTTGATINSCAEILINKGAENNIYYYILSGTTKELG